jgi:hypothetical protein
MVSVAGLGEAQAVRRRERRRRVRRRRVGILVVSLFRCMVDYSELSSVVSGMLSPFGSCTCSSTL